MFNISRKQLLQKLKDIESNDIFFTNIQDEESQKLLSQIQKKLNKILKELDEISKIIQESNTILSKLNTVNESSLTNDNKKLKKKHENIIEIQTKKKMEAIHYQSEFIKYKIKLV